MRRYCRLLTISRTAKQTCVLFKEIVHPKTEIQQKCTHLHYKPASVQLIQNYNDRRCNRHCKSFCTRKYRQFLWNVTQRQILFICFIFESKCRRGTKINKPISCKVSQKEQQKVNMRNTVFPFKLLSFNLFISFYNVSSIST